MQCTRTQEHDRLTLKHRGRAVGDDPDEAFANQARHIRPERPGGGGRDQGWYVGRAGDDLATARADMGGSIGVIGTTIPASALGLIGTIVIGQIEHPPL